MSQPSVDITQVDGAVGILPPSSGRLLAVVGVSSTGAINTPATFARVRDLQGNNGAGPMVEAAAVSINRHGKPALVVRTAATTPGAIGTVVDGMTGTSDVTKDTDTIPNDDYDIYVEFVTGGTIGVAGITYRYSIDEARTMSAITALGTANTLVIPGTGGVGFDFSAGTIVAGDTFSVRCTAPLWTDAELLTALNALGDSVVDWELVHIVGDIDADALAVIDTWWAALGERGKDRAWVGSVRMPDVAESEATYRSSLSTAFLAGSSIGGTLCAGSMRHSSSVSGMGFRRPPSFAVGPRTAAVSEEVNIAAINTGPLPGVSIRDSNGNVIHHDESVNPGLDDARFCVLRTHDQETGVFVNIPRLFSPVGSDFRLMPHRRVMALALTITRTYLRRRLNQGVRVSESTGFILEVDRAEIESGLNAQLAARLRGTKASGVSAVISGTDDLLTTGEITGDMRVVPLGYPERFAITAGFSSPALANATAA